MCCFLFKGPVYARDLCDRCQSRAITCHYDNVDDLRVTGLCLTVGLTDDCVSRVVGFFVSDIGSRAMSVVKISSELLARSPGHLKRKRGEPLSDYLRRLTHLYLQEKGIEEIVRSHKRLRIVSNCKCDIRELIVFSRRTCRYAEI